MIDVFGGEELLRCHVLGGPEDRAELRELLFLGPSQLSKPEVDQLDALFTSRLAREEDIVRLEIPMNDACFVHGLERRTELKGDADHGFNR